MRSGCRIRRKRFLFLVLFNFFGICLIFKTYEAIEESPAFQYYKQVYVYEATRLNIQIQTNIFWNVTTTELIKLKESLPSNMTSMIDKIITQGDDHKRALLYEVERLAKFDGYHVWRNTGSVFDIVRNFKPQKEYEVTRRKIQDDVTEFWYFLNSKFEKLQADAVNWTYQIKDVSFQCALHKRLLMKNVLQLRQVDGYESWRQEEAKYLSDLVQARFNYLQHPQDCKTAKKLVCSHHSKCGFGCQIHHVIKCLSVAYGLERVMIHDNADLIYSGLATMYLPVSNSCRTSVEKPQTWPGTPESEVIEFQKENIMNPRSPFHPVVIPNDLMESLTVLHGDPRLWWVGQLFKYLMRPQDTLVKIIEEHKLKINFSKPVVGVHIRRTDKIGSEAGFHKLEEYMTEVEEYYDQLETVQKIDKRKVYIATDDASVFPEARKLYPGYEIYGDADIAASAGVWIRYSENSLPGILKDIYFLTHSDYVVCTLSSTFCRMVYAIQQQFGVDASAKLRSLDDVYWYSDQPTNDLLAVWPHKPDDNTEMSLEVGDVLLVAGNHWDGLTLATNRRINRRALCPSFKVVKIFETADYPTYPNVTVDSQLPL